MRRRRVTLSAICDGSAVFIFAMARISSRRFATWEGGKGACAEGHEGRQ